MERMDKFDPGYKGDLEGWFVEDIQRAIRMTRSGDACQRVQQVKKNLYSFLHERECAGEMKLEEERWWERDIGRAISRALMQGV